MSEGRAEGSSACSWSQAKGKQDPMIDNSKGLFEFFCCPSIKQDRITETISENTQPPPHIIGGERGPERGRDLSKAVLQTGGRAKTRALLSSLLARLTLKEVLHLWEPWGPQTENGGANAYFELPGSNVLM